MRLLWFVLRILVVLLVFAGAGWAMAQIMLVHAVARGIPEYEVRLAAYTGGLFAGGSVAAIVGVLMVVLDRRAARRR